MTKLFDALDFIGNPFSSYSAENEPEIAEYFVRPPYYEFVRERGLGGGSVVLFGARGAGKSATRLAIAKDVLASESHEKQKPLTLTFDDFSRILVKPIDDVDLGQFVEEIGYLVVESLLLAIATSPDDDKEVMLGALTSDEEKFVVSIVNRFYLSRPAFIREASIAEPLKLLRQAWYKRAKLWMENRWDNISSLVGSIAEGLANKYAGTSLDVDSGFSALLKADKVAWKDVQFVRALLCRFVELSKIFGFSGVTVLIDKVDETSATSNSSTATARLLYPILASTQLLEIPGLSWIFFLWDKVREEYTTNQMPVRLDKIPNATIAWDDQFLSDLVALRLKHFSGGTVESLGRLCSSEVDADEFLAEVVRMSMRSPRELIRILDTIIREHDDEHAQLPELIYLTQSTIDRGVDKYTVDALRRTYGRVHLQQVTRLNLATFINKNVQDQFRINAQSARNRIRGWMDAGMAAQTGTKQAEAGAVGKPSHEYSITDFRIVRAIERSLYLGADLEVGEELDDS